MKTRTLYTMLLAVSLAFAGSCQKDAASGGKLAPGQEIEIAVKACLPGCGPGTRSAETPGDGTLARRAVLQVYEYVGDTREPYRDQIIAEVKDDLSADFTVRVITGHTYDFVFWADRPSPDDAGESAHYVTDDLRSIGYKGDGAPAYVNNDDGYDAFFGVIPAKEISSASALEATLRRPFGQVNLFATDLAEVRPSDIPTHVKVTFSKAYAGFNALTGELAGNADGVLAPAEAVIPVNTGEAVGGMNQMSFDYVFAPAWTAENVQQALVELKAEFYKAGGNVELCNPVTAVAVPVQRNCRTNVCGSLLTTGVDIKVDIDPISEGSLPLEALPM